MAFANTYPTTSTDSFFTGRTNKNSKLAKPKLKKYGAEFGADVIAAELKAAGVGSELIKAHSAYVKFCGWNKPLHQSDEESWLQAVNALLVKEHGCFTVDQYLNKILKNHIVAKAKSEYKTKNAYNVSEDGLKAVEATAIAEFDAAIAQQKKDHWRAISATAEAIRNHQDPVPGINAAFHDAAVLQENPLSDIPAKENEVHEYSGFDPDKLNKSRGPNFKLFGVVTAVIVAAIAAITGFSGNKKQVVLPVASPTSFGAKLNALDVKVYDPHQKLRGSAFGNTVKLYDRVTPDNEAYIGEVVSENGIQTLKRRYVFCRIKNPDVNKPDVMSKVVVAQNNYVTADGRPIREGVAYAVQTKESIDDGEASKLKGKFYIPESKGIPVGQAIPVGYDLEKSGYNDDIVASRCATITSDTVAINKVKPLSILGRASAWAVNITQSSSIAINNTFYKHQRNL